ncbi:MAG TPA: flagellar basal body-associated FliL family protein [Candidatus Tenderia electrophaga]|uniref:Flagellar protein FliL n=1 Tax=Candidatus Tenderia electrophaga TaxID=1748243 RepID=A0A832J987_9GAMM|nr:flagellar basal body-associated FliL family protein [Candidatus Tenderia electrophaga]
MQVLSLKTPHIGQIFKQLSKIIMLAMIFISTASYGSASGGGGGAVADGQANYHTLRPAFVVNIIDGNNMRFMQLEIDLMSMDSHAIQAVQDHRAPIRHELLMLFAHRDISEVMGIKQREKLRQQALEKIQETLVKYADIDSDGTATTEDGHKYPTGIQEVLFTNFVIQ